VIERSLGPARSYAVVSDRFSLLKVAGYEGLRVADTWLINTAKELEAWRDREPFPWVLKANNTFAGSGVRVAYSFGQAQQYFLELRHLFKTKNSFRRLVIDGDPFWPRPWWDCRQPNVVIQRFIHGTPANCVVVCWEGRILAGISVEVLLTDGPNKPATIVRVVNNADMMLAAERIAAKLHLSGFFGLDFIAHNSTGAPYLIEMNPRCTPPCHLPLGQGRDLAGALWAQLSGQPIREFPAVTDNETIAYFPGAWNSDSELLKSSFHDIPQGAPKLVVELLRPSRRRSPLGRAAQYWRSKTRSTKPDALRH
jgi:predicted ATP-grasp superfamily ATP-dependent carboligase